MNTIRRLLLLIVISSALVLAAQAAAFASVPYSLEQIDPSRGVAYHGLATAISGDTAAVSAGTGTTTDWTVYVYTRSGDTWILQQTIAPGIPGFGRSIDIDGDRMIIGAPYASGSGAIQAGRAYVYLRTGTTWSLEAELPGTNVADNWFGYEVSIDGDLAAASVPRATHSDGTTLMAGAIRVYSRASGNWTYLYTVYAEPVYNAWVGGTLGLEDGTLVSSNPERDVDGQEEAGSIYAWTLGPASYTYHGAVISGTSAEEWVGNYLAMSGTTLVFTTANAAKVYVGSGGSWTYQGALTPTSVTPASLRSVAVYGDTAIVASPTQQFAGIATGAAFVFTRSGSIWSEAKLLKPSDGVQNGYFGSHVAISPGMALVGTSTVSKAYFYSTPRLVPVHRFYRPSTGTHFYTADPGEMQNVRDTLGATYSYEGVSYSINSSNPANSLPLYRFYNRRTGTHLYTADEGEKNSILTNLSGTYSLDGVAYHVSLSSGMQVHRFYSPSKGVHFYSSDLSEIAYVRSNLGHIWSYEGPAYQVGQ